MKGILLFLLWPAAVCVLHGQVLITEIMADPLPSNGLPEAEYVEIINRGSEPISLAGWEISDVVTSGKILSGEIAPDSVVILVSVRDTALFVAYGQVAGVSNWPALNNDGDLIRLKDAQGFLLDSLVYNRAWYGDSGKSGGGWSLERIDLQSLCQQMGNWTASVAGNGGTPGRMNSVNASKPDLEGPYIKSAITTDPNTVRVVFSEELENASLGPGNFRIFPETKVQAVEPGMTRDSAWLVLNEPIDSLTEYRVMGISLQDCAGNMKTSEAGILQPRRAGTGTVRINEVLFDPYPGQEDFLEWVNTTSDHLRIESFKLSLYGEDLQVRDHLEVSGEWILAPEQLSLVARNPEQIVMNYARSSLRGSVQTALFNIPNDGGILTLSIDGKSQDSIRIDPQFHHSLLPDTEGRSLERTDPDLAGWLASAWMTSSDRATPGETNSQKTNIDFGADIVRITPRVLYPLHHQTLRIIFTLPVPGIIGSISVYDLEGYRIATLTENQLLDTQQVIRWDGLTDNARLAIPGYYILYCELFGPNGFQRILRRRILIAH